MGLSSKDKPILPFAAQRCGGILRLPRNNFYHTAVIHLSDWFAVLRNFYDTAVLHFVPTPNQVVRFKR